MANEWAKVIRQVAARMNTIIGSQAVDANNKYTGEPGNPNTFLAAQTDSAAYPYQMIVDACAQAEATCAQAIGQTINHPWRHYLYGGPLSEASGALSNGAALNQQAGTAQTGVLGYGQVYVQTGGLIIPCTEKPLEDIVRRNRNAGTFFKLPAYFYRISSSKIYHTVPDPGVRVDFYRYDIGDTYTRIGTGGTGAPIFPSSIVPVYVAGALAGLLKEDEYAGTAQHYMGLYQQLLQQVVNGHVAVDPVQTTAPITGSQIP